MTTPYGEWPSPIDPADVAADGRAFETVHVDGVYAYWLERRPSEGGRSVVCRRPLTADAAGPEGKPGADRVEEVTPAEFDVRTLVYQYGGGDLCVDNGVLIASRMDDGRLYRFDLDDTGGDRSTTLPVEGTPITPEPPEPLAYRYADMTPDPDAAAVYAVRERHVGDDAADEPVNELVWIPTSRDGDDGGTEPTVVASGADFYAAPRPSPDGGRLAYLRWDHPNMPWDGTELVVVDIDSGSAVGDERVIAGGPTESICSPKWSPDGTLHAVSDRTGWWNLYRFDTDEASEDGPGKGRNLYEARVEFGVPQWRLGPSTYAFLEDGRIVTLATEAGEPSVRVLDPDAGTLSDPGLGYTSIRPASIRSAGDRVVFIGRRTDAPAAVVVWEPETAERGDATNRGTSRRLRESTDEPIDDAYVPRPKAITFETGDTVGASEDVAHAHYYPPRNPDVEAPPPEVERPPAVVMVHGGPTSRSEATLSAATAFWTTRGIAVLDVNYRGSTGYGRAYRDALRGEWGVRDVLDCINGAQHAAREGLIDPDRIAISGGSAGGFTVLAALAFYDAFDAGASYYGVADLAALSAETHKFESRYLDGLLGPLPEAEEVYTARSPVFHAEGIDAPLLILQGGKDEVVPPAQAETMIESLVTNRTPYAYIEFPEERHGFRDAESIARAHAAELGFYGETFGFDPDVEPPRRYVGERPPELTKRERTD